LTKIWLFCCTFVGGFCFSTLKPKIDNQILKRISQLLVIAFLAQMACHPALPDEIPLPTKICVRTQHHTLLIPNATIYMKYNSDTFPGYDKPPSFYDASFKTGSDARGCIEPVPEGHHWLVAFGHDSLYYPHDVRGSMKAIIELSNKPVLDTILYISE
jgi:hypothetical protein